MGKPRRKGMRKGYLKQFSAQALNNGRYSPHRPTLAEYARRPRSLGFVNPKSGTVTHELAVPPTKGATQPIKERVKTWELFVHNERHRIRPEEIKVAKEIDGARYLWRLCFFGNNWFWFYKDKKENVMKLSVTYHTAQRAMYVYQADTVDWDDVKNWIIPRIDKR